MERPFSFTKMAIPVQILVSNPSKEPLMLSQIMPDSGFQTSVPSVALGLKDMRTGRRLSNVK
jgi:hypothetical protein